MLCRQRIPQECSAPGKHRYFAPPLRENYRSLSAPPAVYTRRLSGEGFIVLCGTRRGRSRTSRRPSPPVRPLHGSCRNPYCDGRNRVLQPQWPRAGYLAATGPQQAVDPTDALPAWPYVLVLSGVSVSLTWPQRRRSFHRVLRGVVALPQREGCTSTHLAETPWRARPSA